MTDLTELKQKHRKVWAAGDYSRVAQGIQAVADHVVRLARIRPGERVLDIACGTGNAAIAARARGAQVVALDLTPELLEVARQRAEQEGYTDIAWMEGDAENLPFDDGAFDVVISTCGLMFAPDQQKTAHEAARVTRPGGRIAIQAWTPDGGAARMFRLTRSYLPPPADLPSPLNWGDQVKARNLLGAAFEDYQFVYHDCPEFADTPEQLADFWISQFGPAHTTWHALPAEQASAFRNDLIKLYEGYVTPIDGKVRWGREYLVTLATRG